MLVEPTHGSGSGPRSEAEKGHTGTSDVRPPISAVKSRGLSEDWKCDEADDENPVVDGCSGAVRCGEQTKANPERDAGISGLVLVCHVCWLLLVGLSVLGLIF